MPEDEGKTHKRSYFGSSNKTKFNFRFWLRFSAILFVLIVLGTLGYFNRGLFGFKAANYCSPVMSECSADKICQCGSSFQPPSKIGWKYYCTSGLCQPNSGGTPKPVCKTDFPSLKGFADGVASSLFTSPDHSTLVAALNNLKVTRLADYCSSASKGSYYYNLCQDSLRKQTDQAMSLVLEQQKLKARDWFEKQSNSKIDSEPIQDSTQASAFSDKSSPKSNPYVASGKLKLSDDSASYSFSLRSAFGQGIVRTTASIATCNGRTKGLSSSSPYTWTVDVDVKVGNNNYVLNWQDGRTFMANISKSF